MSGNEHDGSNIEPVAKRLRALKGSLGMVIEQSPLAIHVLTPDGQVKAAERLRIGNELRRGVEREEFVLHYQPIVALQTSKVVMVEALACWEHRKGGLLFPSDFIPIAEQTGIIIPIGRQVLREACRQTKEWQTRFPDNPSRLPLTVSQPRTMKWTPPVVWRCTPRPRRERRTP